MKYAKLMKNDTVDTDSGICVSIWMQGCPFRCKGCHNPDTWDYNGGIDIDESILIEMVIDAINENGINRNLSILGGEPLCPKNVHFVKKLIDIVKQKYPNIKIFCWTGYSYEDLWIQPMASLFYILQTVDVLITGPYIEEQRDITLKLRGSRNQEIWRRKNDKLVLDTSEI